MFKLPAFSFEFFAILLYEVTMLVDIFVFCWFGNEIHVKVTILLNQ